MKQTERDAAYDVIMLVLNDVAHDRRVRAEAAALAEVGWRVLVLGTQRAEGSLPDHEQLPCSQGAGADLWRVRYGRWGARLWRPWRWVRQGLQLRRLVAALRSVEGRAWHAHDLPALLVMAAARGWNQRGIPIVYDSHELYLYMPVREMTGRWHALTRPVFWWLEGALARRCAAVITVSATNARALRRWHRLREVVVVRNAVDPTPAGMGDVAPLLRQIAGAGHQCLVHSGEVTNRGRALTELVEALALLPDTVEIVFLGQGEAVAPLRALAEERTVGGRVHFVPPVAPEDVPAVLRGADAAVVLRRADSWHSRATLPVKLFEAVAAGLPVIASRDGALGRIVRQVDLGAVCDPTDPAAIAHAVRRVLAPDAQTYYRGRVRAAQATLTWRMEAQRLTEVYRNMLGQGG